eukprot:scaffold2268_cov61-Attheya_sp.AAC.1
MPIRVTLRVKRPSPLVHERHPIVKKQRTTRIPGIPNTTDGSAVLGAKVLSVNHPTICTFHTRQVLVVRIKCNSIGIESALCEASYDPHLSHKTSTSSSNQISSQFGTVDQFKCHSPWDGSFQELLDFKKVHGHTEVPQRSGPLGTWVKKQRRLKGGKELRLSSDRRKQLESIGFTFKNRKGTNSTPLRTWTTRWDQRFQELVDFKKINGHTKVPQRSGILGRWVSHQRTEYRLLKEGKQDSQLTSDRLKICESIGFEFKCPSRGGPHWEQRFQELVDFKKINGHTNVPQPVGLLGKWVSRQRMEYRLLKEGKDSRLTSDRCKKFESIGFEFKWAPPTKDAPTGPPWDQRFQELVDFKKINGHTNVPQLVGLLGRWVKRQRTEYRFLKEGKDSQLTSDRLKKLESIGFEFKCHPSWDQRFQELVDFKKVHGSTDVNQPSGPLGKWVKNQHRLKGGNLRLTSDRRKKLESIGFIFKIRKK